MIWRNTILIDIGKDELKQIKGKGAQKLSKRDYDRKIAEWQMFYLNNLDIYTEDYLQIPLHFFQRQILLDCWENNIMDIVASRGLSKSFIIAVLANDLALLLPGIRIIITSSVLQQSNIIIKEKIDDLLSSEQKGISPVLKQLRKDGYIKFGKAETTDALIVEYGNGAKIFAAACGDSSRGLRANISITDEAKLVNGKKYYGIIEPTLEPYFYNGLYLETKQIFLTSSRTKDNWFWAHLKQTVRNHYTDKNIKYGFFGGDIFTAVANRIQSKKQYISRRATSDDLNFEMEYLNLWLGESEGSLFLYDDFHRNQKLSNAFYPLTDMEYIDGEQHEDYNFNDNEIRTLTADIAVSGGRENDNSIFILGNMNKENNHRKVEFIKHENGLNSQTQIVEIKRLFYDYKCKYFVMDSKGEIRPFIW